MQSTSGALYLNSSKKSPTSLKDQNLSIIAVPTCTWCIFYLYELCCFVVNTTGKRVFLSENLQHSSVQAPEKNLTHTHWHSLYALTFYSDIWQSIVQLDPRVMKYFLQLPDKDFQCIEWFHFKSVLFLLRGLVIWNCNSFSVGTVVNQVEKYSWRVNVTFPH